MYLDLYDCLTEEEDHSAVNSFLQDLMEQELLDSGTVEELASDVGQIRKKFRNPIITMEARHQQVCDQSDSCILSKKSECCGLKYCHDEHRWANELERCEHKLCSQLH